MARPDPDPLDQRIHPKQILLLGLLVCLGFMAIQWSLRSPRSVAPRRPGQPSRLESGKSPDLWGRKRLGARSPFVILTSRSMSELAGYSRVPCRLVQVSDDQRVSKTRVYRPVGKGDCRYIIKGGSFALADAWLDDRGVRSLSLLPSQDVERQPFWREVRRFATRDFADSEVFCWPDACVRFSPDIYGVWRIAT